MAGFGAVRYDAIPAECRTKGFSPSVMKPSEVYSASEITIFPFSPSVTSISIGATIACREYSSVPVCLWKKTHHLPFIMQMLPCVLPYGTAVATVLPASSTPRERASMMVPPYVNGPVG